MNTRCSCRNNDNKARRFVVGMHSVRRAHTLMFTAALAIVLGGCGSSNGSGSQAAAVNDGTQGPQLESRPAEARRAGAPSPRDLAFLRYAIDVSKDLPRACLAFSTSLDPQRDYSPFVAVAPQTRIALSVEGANLCLGGLAFGQSRELTLRAGLPAADGRVLVADETITVEFGDRPAYIGFKGEGIVLPRIDADGLALETVNVEQVKVTVSRVTDRALAFRTLTSGFSSPAGTFSFLEEDSNPSNVKQTLWTGTIDTRGSPNVAVTTVFPIAKAVPRLQPGAYFVELDQADAAGKSVRQGALAKRWLIITDLALTTYSGRDGLSATVRSLQTARPLKGVRLELVARSNEVLARGQSDGDGHIRFPGPLTNG